MQLDQPLKSFWACRDRIKEESSPDNASQKEGSSRDHRPNVDPFVPRGGTDVPEAAGGHSDSTC